MACSGFAFRVETDMEVDGPEGHLTGRLPKNSWTFYNDDVEKLSCFDDIIQRNKRANAIVIKKEEDPILKLTITLCDERDTVTSEEITKLQKDLEKVHTGYIIVEREHVDAAKQFMKDNEEYISIKLFSRLDFRKIVIYSKSKDFIDCLKRRWDGIVSRQEKKENSMYTPNHNEKSQLATGYNSENMGNRMHPKHQCVCTTKEKLKVFVYCESIVKANVDIIVNAANEDLDHSGGVAAVIARAAGRKLTDESNALIEKCGRFKTTQVEMTTGGSLPYRFVLHAIGPRWKMYPNRIDCLTDLERTIRNVLVKANTIGFTSIAVPAISAGLFEVPQELCAEVYAISIHNFSEQYGLRSSVRDIHFVDVNPIMVQKIREAFENFEKNGSVISLTSMKRRYPLIKWTSPPSSVKTPESKTSHQSHSLSQQSSADQHRGLPSHQQRAETPSQSGRSNAKLVKLPDVIMANIPVKCFQFKNGLLVKIYTGSIVKFHGDAIVISADTVLSGSGFLGDAVRKAGGQEYAKEFENLKSKKPVAKLGDVLHCKGGKVGARHVMHLVLSQLNTTQEHKLVEYKKYLKNAFEKINGLSWKKIAMPLLGAGFIEKDTTDLQKCCQAWFSVLSEFASNREHTCHISEVHLINKNTKITSSLINNFEVNCSKDSTTATVGQKSYRGAGRHTDSGSESRTVWSSNNPGNNNKAYDGRSFEHDKVSSRRHETEHGSSLRNKSMIDYRRKGQQSIEKSRTHRSSAEFSQNGARPKEVLRRSHSTPQATGAERDFDMEAFFQTNQSVEKSSATKPSGNLKIIDSGSEDSAEEDVYETVSSFMVKPLKSKGEEESAPCVICLSDITNGMKLDCGHEFCKECLQQSFQQHKQACPVCGTIYGIVKGNQPLNGTMKVKTDKYLSLPGYEEYGTITIKYYFPNGTQGPEHPNPGRPYEGTERRGFLPDNEEGRKVLRLLQKAFDRRLTFTIGHSRTTGKDNIVTWNDIHHKTKRDTGAQRFGYPDPTYLQRVQEELAAKGVTE